jgi:hypothetical protein
VREEEEACSNEQQRMARHLQLVELGKRELPQLESRLAAALAVLKSVTHSGKNHTPLRRI